MTILYITSGSENVGTYFRALFWAKYLVRAGHEVTLVSGHERPSWAISRRKMRDGVRILTFIKSPLRWDYPGYILRCFLIFWQVLRTDMDVLHVFVGWQPPSLAALLAGLLKRTLTGAGIRIICDWDDLWGGPEGIAHEHGHLISGVATRLEYTVPRWADRITVCSSFLREYAQRHGCDAGRLTVIHNGSNVEDIRPQPQQAARKALRIPARAQVLLYIGQYQSPIVGTLLTYLKSYCRNHPHTVTYILGSLPEPYRKIIAGTDALVYVGKVPYDRLPQYLSAADLLFLAMDDSDVERARFPIRFGDYLASGTPMVIMPQGEVADLVNRERIAYGTTLAREAVFAATVSRALRDPARKALGRKARRFAEKRLAWNIIAARLIELYETT